MNPQAKKRGGMMFGGMKAKLNNPQTRRGKMQLPNAKIRKYAEGGEIDDNAPLSRNNPSADMPGIPKMDQNPKKQSFKEAFAEAKDGSVFTWNGKEYKKEYAKPKSDGPLMRPRTVRGNRDGSPNHRARPAVPLSQAPKSEAPRAAAPKPAAPASGLKGKREAFMERLGERRRAAGIKDQPPPDLSIPMEIPALKARREAFMQRAGERRRAAGIPDQPPPDLGIPTEIPALKARREAFMQRMAERRNAAPGMAKGGSVESKSMMKKEVAFMKKKGAPKSMIKHEEAEAKGMKRGGMACGGMKKYAAGGSVKKPYKPTAGDINEKAGGDQEMEMRMERGYRPGGRGPLSRNAMKPKAPAYARGGGVETHGKTKGTFIKMASGGSVSARADGVAVKGKTNCKMR